MSAENQSPEDEELFPDERPHRRYWALDIPEKTQKSPTDEPPFHLQPSTAADKPVRKKSRGKQGRDPVCTKYRMAWVLVFFDLPVGTPEERRDAANFRKGLIRDGYVMVQFSVYARPCGSADRVETQVRRLRSKIPPRGEVRGMIVTDAQWGRMIVMRSRKREEPEDMPEQMMFF